MGFCIAGACCDQRTDVQEIVRQARQVGRPSVEKLVRRADWQRAWSLSAAKVRSITAELGFPAPRRFGRSIRWVEREVEAWSLAQQSTPPRPRSRYTRPDQEPIRFRMTPMNAR